MSYSLYLMTYAFDSVADVFGSLFALATGLIVVKSGVLPRWLGWVSILVGVLFFLQAFGLGGVIANRSEKTDEIDRFNAAIGIERVAHFPQLEPQRLPGARQPRFHGADRNTE